MLTLTFIDFDHENERHAQISLLHGFKIGVARAIATNPDYLRPGADVPDDWEDARELTFTGAEAARRFVFNLADKLLDNCFAYFHDDEEVDDSDDAREIITGLLESYGDDVEAGAGAGSDDHIDRLVAELTQYPR